MVTWWVGKCNTRNSPKKSYIRAGEIMHSSSPGCVLTTRNLKYSFFSLPEKVEGSGIILLSEALSSTFCGMHLGRGGVNLQILLPELFLSSTIKGVQTANTINPPPHTHTPSSLFHWLCKGRHRGHKWIAYLWRGAEAANRHLCSGTTLQTTYDPYVLPQFTGCRILAQRLVFCQSFPATEALFP